MLLKKILAILAVLMLTLTAVGCSNNTGTDGSTELSAGRYVGYSWQDEASGTVFEDADQYIETILELDQNGIITDAKMRFFVKKDGFWIPRQSGNAFVNVNFSADPTPAVPGENYKAGDSMFTVYTADMMSFYAAAVNSSGVTAVALVDPVTRYQFEMKLPQNFDYTTPVGDLTIGSGKLVPTIRTSGSGLLKPSDWESMADKNIFNIDVWSHVVNNAGVLEGISATSSVQAFLEALGVEFSEGRPQPMAVKYGYFGLGGWAGNYSAIEAYLIGQDAAKMTSLVDWSVPRYAGAINDQNQFGIDVGSGATKTVQNSIDTISGATVRMSRESTSYQRALVQAGIIDDSDVIIGRF
jgi:hypothetical protein